MCLYGWRRDKFDGCMCYFALNTKPKTKTRLLNKCSPFLRRLINNNRRRISFPISLIKWYKRELYCPYVEWLLFYSRKLVFFFVYNTRQNGCCLIRQTTTFHSANRFTGMLIISMGGKRNIPTTNHQKKTALHHNKTTVFVSRPQQQQQQQQ